MIRLTIQTESQEETLTFDKPEVTLGCGSEADIPLPDEGLERVHVKILNQDGRYTVINIANDPFVTINSLPFGKKVIRPQDILQIHQTMIRFEGPAYGAQPYKPQQTANRNSSENIESLAQTSKGIQSRHRIEAAIDRKISVAQSSDSLVDNEIDDLIREAEMLAGDDDNSTIESIIAEEEDELQDILDEEISLARPEEVGAPLEVAPSMPAQKEPNGTPHEQQEALLPSKTHAHEDSYVYDLEEEGSPSNSEQEGKEGQEERGWTSWNFFFIVLVAIATIAVVIAAGAYIALGDRSYSEQMTAAEGVADVAMALTYAQVHHIKPQKQNWSDPEFIKNNLSPVLSPEFPTFANIDNQGQFTDCPYILRIYTSTDLSEFLVIAQPEPSLLQWLIPKTAIVIDSKLMEMRTVHDIKGLNRLLLHVNALDKTNMQEISELVRQGTLIPLSTLANKRENPGFAPPKALSFIRPGAENLIYNAPRYYQFGESVLKRAMSLLYTLGNSHEVVRLKQELDELSNFPDLVLYSTQGLQKALDAQKALATLAPHNKFLTGYLSFSSKGNLTSTHLLLNEEPPASSQSAIVEKDPLFNLTPSGTQVASGDHNVSRMVNAPTVPALKFDRGIDRNHPLFLRLTSLAKARQQALKPISDQMIELLNNHTEQSMMQFTSKFGELWSRYKAVEKEQREKVTEGMKKLYSEYDIPLAQFASYVSVVGLEAVAKTGLASHAAQGGMKYSADQINQQLQKIQKAEDFAALENSAKEAYDMMSLNNFPDSEKLIIYQNQMRVVTLERLRAFILAPPQVDNPPAFNEDNRAILARILQIVWVNDPEEYDYYMREYEARMEMPAKQNDESVIGKIGLN